MDRPEGGTATREHYTIPNVQSESDGMEFSCYAYTSSDIYSQNSDTVTLSVRNATTTSSDLVTVS